MATKRTDGRYTIKKTFNGKPKYFYGKTKKRHEKNSNNMKRSFLRASTSTALLHYMNGLILG